MSAACEDNSELDKFDDVGCTSSRAKHPNRFNDGYQLLILPGYERIRGSTTRRTSVFLSRLWCGIFRGAVLVINAGEHLELAILFVQQRMS
jgi:hypothetical protein